MATSQGEKKGQKPSGNLEGVKVAEGLEKAPQSKGEVAGHIGPGLFICWNDGALNYVPGPYSYFWCFRCYALNRC